MTRITASVGWILSSVALCLLADGSSHAQDPPQIADIVSSIKRAEKLFLEADGFRVRCQRVKSEDITPTRYSGGYLNVEFDVAHKKGRWITRKTFLPGSVIPAGVDIQISTNTTVCPSQEGVTLQWEQPSGIALVSSFDHGGDSLRHLDYFRHVGFDIAKAITKANHVDYEKLRKEESLLDDLDHPFLPEYLEKNASKYVVHPSMESVDNASCWVVEFIGMDKLWLDPTRGYAVRRRIYHFDVGKPCKFEIRNQDFREVAPGLWLPFLQVVDKYASISSEASAVWGKVASRMRYEVKELTVGSVSDDVFKVEIPPGVLVQDFRTGMVYRVPANSIDPLRGPDTSQWTAVIASPPKPKRRLGTAVLVVVLTLGLIALAWRIKRLRASLRILLFVSALLSGFCSSRSRTVLGGEIAAKPNQVTSPPSDTIGKTTLEPAASHPMSSDLFSWKPAWRRKGDCGVCSLFALMAVCGQKATFSEVAERIPVDPREGCSMLAMCQAANDLGFPVEARFVNPRLVTTIPLPCIIHGSPRDHDEAGHFLLLVDYNQATDSFDVFNPLVEESRRLSVPSVMRQFSGYAVFPLAKRWDSWDSALDRALLLLAALVLGAAALCPRFLRFRRSTPASDLFTGGISSCGYRP